MTTFQPPEIDPQAVGTRLQGLREAKGLSQRQVSHLLGCTEGTLSRIETGVALPKSPLALGLAKLYGSSVEYVLTGEDSAAPKLPVAVFEQVDAYLASELGASVQPTVRERLRDPTLWSALRIVHVDETLAHSVRMLLETTEATALRARARTDKRAGAGPDLIRKAR